MTHLLSLLEKPDYTALSETVLKLSETVYMRPVVDLKRWDKELTQFAAECTDPPTIQRLSDLLEHHKKHSYML